MMVLKHDNNFRISNTVLVFVHRYYQGHIMIGPIAAYIYRHVVATDQWHTPQQTVIIWTGRINQL